MRVTQSKYLRLLMITAFLVKAIFSVGFMPVANADSLNVIEICTSQGLTKIISHNEEVPEEDSKVQQKCPFSPGLNYGTSVHDITFAHSVDTQYSKYKFPEKTATYFSPYKDWKSQAPPFAS